jgi:hypothetical protein
VSFRYPDERVSLASSLPLESSMRLLLAADVQRRTVAWFDQYLGK